MKCLPGRSAERGRRRSGGGRGAGKITAEIAKAKAETEFEKYRVIQDRLFMSDFDKYMLEPEENAKK